MKLVAAVIVATACGGNQLEAAPDVSSEVPAAKLEPASTEAFCVTKGAASLGGKITEPTVRAVARGSSGDTASLTFTYRGETETTRELASGQARRQLGLKLRADNSCNLIYVMWRLDPRPKLEVSIKHNPGKRTHAECGASGYLKLAPQTKLAPPALEAGATHTLRAAITGDVLTAWIDHRVVWRGELPDAARDLSGPAGLRSDNLAFDLLELGIAPGTQPSAAPRCHAEESD